MRLRHLSLGAYARGVLSLSHTCAQERPLNLSSSKSCEIGKRNEIIQMGSHGTSWRHHSCSVG